METSTQVLQRQQRDMWQQIGAEPVYARGTVRLPQFKKSFAPDQQVKIRDPQSGECVPFLLKSGRPLLCSEVLPERADLALNEDGVMLSQADFRERYEVYLNSFVFPPDSDRSFEPVPNVAQYINKKPDTWSDSRGLVDIDYDPQLDKPFKPQKFYGPDGESEEEYMASKAEQSDIKALLAELVKNQIAMTRIGGDQSEAVVPVTTEAMQEAVSQMTPAEAAVDPAKEAAPCGSYVTAGYVKQHQRHCKDERCSPGDDAA